MIRKKKTIKPKPVVVVQTASTLPFHLVFPVHLSYKDNTEKKDCYFKDEVDLKKYIKRYNLKKYIVTETEPRN